MNNQIQISKLGFVKPFLFIITYLLIHALIGQEVKYVAIYLDACDSVTRVGSKSMYVAELEFNREMSDHFFYFEYDARSKGVYKFVNDTVILPDTGRYKHRVQGIGRGFSSSNSFYQTLYIKEPGVKCDTFYLPSFQLKVIDTTKTKDGETYQFRYMDCNSIANGKHVGYYYDGRIRIESTFKEGMPIDSIKHYYYSTGKLSNLGFITKRGYTQYEYLEDGEPFSKRIYSRGLLKLWGTELYFVRDTLKEKWSRYRWHILPQKTLKYNNGEDITQKEIWSKSLIYYYNNEPVKKLSRRRRYFQGRFSHEKETAREVEYRYKLNLYDTLGNRLIKVKYDKRDYTNFGIEDHNFNSYFGFCKLKVYKNKIKQYKVKNRYVRAEYEFRAIKYTRSFLFWKKISSLNNEEIDLIIKENIDQTNLKLINKESSPNFDQKH